MSVGLVWWLTDLVVSAEIRTCRNQVAGRSRLPHAEIMTSPNTVLLKRGTERCDMQLSQQLKLHYIMVFVSVVHVQG